MGIRLSLARIRPEDWDTFAPHRDWIDSGELSKVAETQFFWPFDELEAGATLSDYRELRIEKSYWELLLDVINTRADDTAPMTRLIRKNIFNALGIVYFLTRQQTRELADTLDAIPGAAIRKRAAAAVSTCAMPPEEVDRLAASIERCFRTMRQFARLAADTGEALGWWIG